MKYILICLMALLPFVGFSKTVWLDQLNVQLMYQDWGTAQINKCVLGTSLRVAGVDYKRGVGTHSISRFLINVGGKAKSFSGFVGADDHNDFGGNLEFRLLADKKLIWSSGVMYKGMPAKPFKVSLAGVQKLVLLVVDAGDGIMYDHADWLEAKFETNGEVFSESVIPAPIEVKKYVLTPKSSTLPAIHSAKIFGVRPGNPFLYTIAATGKRPMAFYAEHLPLGLTLDSVTGLIRGTVEKAGTYMVVLRADNALGSDTRILRIEVGDQICLTPPMGWNSWNCWGLKVNEDKIKDAALYMRKNLMDHGWSYINIDDGWEADKRTSEGILNGNEKFPDFKGLCNFVHDQGLKFGIYSSPGPKTCGGHLGSYQYEKIDAQTWADWGVDYLKYDYCYYCDIAPKPTEELIKAPYVVMRHALDSVKRDMVYCVGYGAPRVWIWGAEAGGNQWRTTRDITDEWNVVRSIGFLQDVCASATKPGNYNDPDMLVVGKLGQGWGSKVHDSYLTADEQYSHISLWCLLSAPLLIGCDMNNMDDFTLNLLTNDEVIAVDQDPAVLPVKKIVTPNGQIWYKYLEDGSVAVGLFNVDPYYILWDQKDSEKVQREKYNMTLNFADLNLKGKYTVRDLWRQQNLGSFSESFSTKVAYHGVSFVRLIPEK